MKTTTKTIVTLLAFSASALVASAQNFGGPPPGGDWGPPGMGQGNGPGPGNGPGGPNGRRHPPSLLMDALDVNHDGVIDSNEIANASAELKKLDKNGDGKLTPDELWPQRPQRPPRGDAQGPQSNRQGPPAGDNRQNGPPGPDSQRGQQGPPGGNNLDGPPGPNGQGQQQGPPPGN